MPVDILKNSGADVLVLNCAPPISARAIRRAAELDWHPVLLLVNAAASIANACDRRGFRTPSAYLHLVPEGRQ